MIDDHKTRTIEYAYQRFTAFSYDQYKNCLRSSEVPESERKTIDSMWSRLMQNGAEAFFLEETAVPEDEIDFEIANVFIWIYKRDGWTTFRPYWQILRVTWRNHKAMPTKMGIINTTNGVSSTNTPGPHPQHRD